MISNSPRHVRSVSAPIPVGDIAIACLVEVDAATGGEIYGGQHYLVGDEVSVGRARGCDVQLRQDAQISRRHCVLRREAGTWWLTDSGSTHGVRVNGRPVVERALHDGDRVRLGRSVFRFHAA